MGQQRTAKTISARKITDLVLLDISIFAICMIFDGFLSMKLPAEAATSAAGV